MTFEIPSPFEWDVSFDVKNHNLNEQHKRLFALINKLAANHADAAALKELLDYVLMHFKTEEDLFAQFHYEKAVEHKATHDKLVQDALAIKEVNDGVITFLKGWLVNHIKGSDQQYADLLAGK